MLELIAAAVIAAGVALYWNGRAYTARVERRWPPQGRFIDIGGARLHVVERGPADAPRVLLIHGASANLREVLPPLIELETDHRVIAMDRPGYGYSSRPRGSESLALQARFAAGVLEAIGAGPALIVGQSLGAAVALRLAHDRPELVRGLVLIAPATHPYPGDNVWWARLAATPLIGPAFAALFVPFAGPAMAQAGVANTFAPAPVPKTYEEEAGIGLTLRPRAFVASARDVVASKKEFVAQALLYPEISAPTIIITADKDRVVSPKIHARALAGDLPAAELVIAPGAGHMPHRVRTDLVLAAIRRVEAMAGAGAES